MPSSRSQRHRMILELLCKYSLETQAQVLEKLSACGYVYSQATISRDFKALNIVKEEFGKTFRYSPINQAEKRCVKYAIEESLIMPFKNSVINTYSVGNIVLIETTPGLANAVGVYIDGIINEKILGCVARRNKVLVIMRDDMSAKSFKITFEK